jgi:stage V sporulation protein B
MTSPEKEQARQAGRGGVAVLGAKVFFVVSGLAQQALLPRAIGLAGYGAFSGRVLPIASILYNVVIASSVQGVSRTISRSFGHERAPFHAVFRVHVKLAFALAALFAVMAPAFAWFAGAQHIAVPLAVMAFVILLYGVYAPIIGLLNGRGEFTRQAALDVTFAVIRTIAMVGIGWLFVRRTWPGETGAALGFVIAAACIVGLAARLAFPLRVSSDEKTVAPPTTKGYLAELWPLAAAQFFTNAVMQVDILLLGHFLSRRDPSNVTAADEWVGVYRACQLFAFLPYQLLLSITQILFPMLARARADADPVRIRIYVERGARLAAIACGMMVSVLVAAPESVIRFAYTAQIAARGAPTLRILALGQGAYTMLAIATTTLASLGRERLASRITFGALTAVLIACAVLAWHAAFGERQLEATAIGTSAGLSLSLIVAALHVRKEVGGFVPLLTVARVLCAVTVAGTVGSFVPTTGMLVTPFVAVGIAGVYFVVLVVSRELTSSDAHALRALRDT